MKTKMLIFICLFLQLTPVVAEDTRVKVDLPEMMRDHMLNNMRDHLLALEEITRNLANHEYDTAAEIAESRLGMTSMKLHGAAHMSHFLPAKMGAIGTEMHRAASRFALAAKDAEIEGGLNKAFSALSGVMQQCVACHSGYRVH